jgi:hypothetical protein
VTPYFLKTGTGGCKLLRKLSTSTLRQAQGDVTGQAPGDAIGQTHGDVSGQAPGGAIGKTHGDVSGQAPGPVNKFRTTVRLSLSKPGNET